MANRRKGSALSPARGNPGRLVLLRLGVWTLLTILAVAILAGGGIAMSNLFYADNPRTLLRSIDVQMVNGQLNADQLRQVLAVQPGIDNLLHLDLEALRLALLKDPRLEQAEVRRRFPGTLEVKAYLRMPVARLVNDQGLLIDRHGQILPPMRLASAERLPVILGVRDVRSFSPGDIVAEDEMVRGALNFLRVRATHTNGAWLDVATIQLDYWHRWINIHLHENRQYGIRRDAKITIGLDDISVSIDRALQVVAMRSSAGQPTSLIEALSDKVVVRP